MGWDGRKVVKVYYSVLGFISNTLALIQGDV
jgi:hypothetical protein